MLRVTENCVPKIIAHWSSELNFFVILNPLVYSPQIAERKMKWVGGFLPGSLNKSKACQKTK